MTDTEQVNEKYASFMEEAKNLKTALESLKKFNSIDDLQDKLSLVDYAQLNASLAYLLTQNSTYLAVYMKTNGISLEDHKINEEIERIKEYFTKIQEVILVENDQRKNPLSVNKDAAERMIKSHLQENFSREEGSNVMDEEDVWEIKGNQEQSKNNKKAKKLVKGALVPSGTHLSWKDEIEKIMK